jgi:hypothetical protein
MMIVNEELEYVLETIRFKTSIYRDKKKRNLTFNDDDYYSNILNEYITNLQQENARLKNKIKTAFEYVDDKLTNLNLKYGVDNEFREEYNELWEILKEN